jgi:hypothetical protein
LNEISANCVVRVLQHFVQPQRHPGGAVRQCLSGEILHHEVIDPLVRPDVVQHICAAMPKKCARLRHAISF